MNTLRIEGRTLSLAHDQSLVCDLSFSIESGEVLGLMGPSGKSSILAWLTGTSSPQISGSGSIWLANVCISGLPTERRRLDLILQQDYLFPHMSVRDNLLFGLRDSARSERLERVQRSLQDAGLGDMGQRDPATLSGGQRARVSLLRTLLSNPCALLLDELFSRLYVAMRSQIRSFTWASTSKLSVLLVTHNVSDVPPGARILDIGHLSHGEQCPPTDNS